MKGLRTFSLPFLSLSFWSLPFFSVFFHFPSSLSFPFLVLFCLPFLIRLSFHYLPGINRPSKSSYGASGMLWPPHQSSGHSPCCKIISGISRVHFSQRVHNLAVMHNSSVKVYCISKPDRLYVKDGNFVKIVHQWESYLNFNRSLWYFSLHLKHVATLLRGVFRKFEFVANYTVL